MANQQDQSGGTQAGGGPTQSDMGAPGGSSGTGGYGKGQNQANHQGQEGQLGQTGYGSGQDPQQSRGEAFDEQQGGGRGPDSIAADQTADERREEEDTAKADEFLQDQQEHQNRGQSEVEAGA